MFEAPAELDSNSLGQAFNVRVVQTFEGRGQDGKSLELRYILFNFGTIFRVD